MIFAMCQICLILSDMLIVQMFFHKHENIDAMCKIVMVELDKLGIWFALNKLALNIPKTNFMIFSHHKSIENNISIDGVNLQKVENFLVFDHQITWIDPIAYISNKLSKSMAIVHRASHVPDTKPCTVYAMQYSKHILVIALRYGEILVKTISTQYLF